jgi:hypothetical protein
MDGNVERVVKIIIAYTVFVGIKRDLFEDIGLDWRIILKWKLKKNCGRFWNGSI